ncbi:hypothetical protein KSP40_PGU008873 [Platanthera guangdongensis]|uniref:Uncharacterized protein n=1 Tax=Platanthera guangdongensis TaxID=2320717 RepID=A0ABR2N449_9ASPA
MSGGVAGVRGQSAPPKIHPGEMVSIIAIAGPLLEVKCGRYLLPDGSGWNKFHRCDLWASDLLRTRSCGPEMFVRPMPAKGDEVVHFRRPLLGGLGVLYWFLVRTRSPPLLSLFDRELVARPSFTGDVVQACLLKLLLPRLKRREARVIRIERKPQPPPSARHPPSPSASAVRRPPSPRPRRPPAAIPAAARNFAAAVGGSSPLEGGVSSVLLEGVFSTVSRASSSTVSGGVCWGSAPKGAEFSAEFQELQPGYFESGSRSPLPAHAVRRPRAPAPFVGRHLRARVVRRAPFPAAARNFAAAVGGSSPLEGGVSSVLLEGVFSTVSRVSSSTVSGSASGLPPLSAAALLTGAPPLPQDGIPWCLFHRSFPSHLSRSFLTSFRSAITYSHLFSPLFGSILMPQWPPTEVANFVDCTFEIEEQVTTIFWSGEGSTLQDPASGNESQSILDKEHDVFVKSLLYTAFYIVFNTVVDAITTSARSFKYYKTRSYPQASILRRIRLGGVTFEKGLTPKMKTRNFHQQKFPVFLFSFPISLPITLPEFMIFLQIYDEFQVSKLNPLAS